MSNDFSPSGYVNSFTVYHVVVFFLYRIVANSVNNETNLPEVMASLEMLTVDVNSPSKVVTKRVLRKRIPRKDVPVVTNRR